MAQVDTGIYQNLLRPPKSVQEYDAEAQQAEGNKLGLLLQRGQYDQQQRGVADDAAYRDAVRGFGADSGANANMLRVRGLGKQAMDYEKSALDASKTSTEVANLKKTGAKTDGDLMDASLKRYRTGLDFIETPQGAASWLKAQYEDPALSALMNSRGTFEEAIKHIPQTPAEFDQWRQKVAMGIENYSKKLQEDRKQDENERNNKAHQVIASRNASTSEGQLGVAQGNLGLRQREFTHQQGKDAMGDGAKPPAGYRYTADGSLEAIPGGPADLKAQAVAQQKASGGSDVDVALSTLRDAYDRLETGGGITSTKNGMLGNLAASTSSSGIGQATGRAFGTNNQSARNDIAMSRPALLAAMMKATGMSAKQMDSNAELKLWLATATDPTLDIESNRRALANIERKYINGAQPAAAPKPTAPMGLKAGAVDGGYRFKGGNPADKSNWEKVK